MYTHFNLSIIRLRSRVSSVLFTDMPQGLDKYLAQGRSSVNICQKKWRKNECNSLPSMCVYMLEWLKGTSTRLQWDISQIVQSTLRRHPCKNRHAFYHPIHWMTLGNPDPISPQSKYPNLDLILLPIVSHFQFTLPGGNPFSSILQPTPATNSSSTWNLSLTPFNPQPPVQP